MPFSRLYLHIPWCLAKCSYCAFCSQTGSAELLAETTDLLLQEMTLSANRLGRESTLDSIYFGGGTPSLLLPGQVSLLIEASRNLWRHRTGIEITLEANPGAVTAETLAGFREAGVNRISLGIQSFNNVMLKRLGRVHTAEQAYAAFNSARQTGFDSVGIDLICGLPGQDLADWTKNLSEAVHLQPDHISVYSLTIEEGTDFARLYPPDSSELPDDDQTAAMLEQADHLLTNAGFEHYELANFAKPGKRSAHNCGYWQRDGYLGLGPSAHSFMQEGWGLRFHNPADYETWAAGVRNSKPLHLDMAALSRDEARAETIFLGLRQSDGINLDRYEELFGERLEKIFAEQLERLLNAGLVVLDSVSLKLTARGMLLSNQVFVLFL